MGSVTNVYATRYLFSCLLVVCQTGGVTFGGQSSAKAVQDLPFPQSDGFPNQGKGEKVGGGEGLLPT